MFSSSSFTDKTKHMFHDANSKRGGVLMHAKVLIALFEPAPSPLGASASSSGKRKADELDEGEGVGGWAYVGSHNFSPSAWVRTCSEMALTSRAPSTLITSPRPSM